MITINGRKFAENKQEQVASLFSPEGTPDGLAKRKGNTIHLYHLDGTLFAAIGRNGHGSFFVSCHKTESGQTWYQYTLTSNAEEFFGTKDIGLCAERQMVDDLCREIFDTTQQHA